MIPTKDLDANCKKEEGHQVHVITFLKKKKMYSFYLLLNKYFIIYSTFVRAFYYSLHIYQVKMFHYYYQVCFHFYIFQMKKSLT